MLQIVLPDDGGVTVTDGGSGVDAGVGVGVGAGVGFGVAAGFGVVVGLGVVDGFGVAVGFAVGLGVDAGFGDAVGLGVADSSGDDDLPCTCVGLAVFIGSVLCVGVGCGVSIGGVVSSPAEKETSCGVATLSSISVTVMLISSDAVCLFIPLLSCEHPLNNATTSRPQIMIMCFALMLYVLLMALFYKETGGYGNGAKASIFSFSAG